MFLVILKANRMIMPNRPMIPGIKTMEIESRTDASDTSKVTKTKIARKIQKAPPSKANRSMIKLNFLSNQSINWLIFCFIRLFFLPLD
jgi:hypothetical protein